MYGVMMEVMQQRKSEEETRKQLGTPHLQQSSTVLRVGSDACLSILGNCLNSIGGETTTQEMPAAPREIPSVTRLKRNFARALGRLGR